MRPVQKHWGPCHAVHDGDTVPLGCRAHAIEPFRPRANFVRKNSVLVDVVLDHSNAVRIVGNRDLPVGYEKKKKKSLFDASQAPFLVFRKKAVPKCRALWDLTLACRVFEPGTLPSSAGVRIRLRCWVSGVLPHNTEILTRCNTACHQPSGRCVPEVQIRRERCQIRLFGAL